MTTLNGLIIFNASTGSDSAASGCGPATALTGTGAATTGASAVVTGISTTGVTAGDLLWVLSSSGRQFSVIASVDSATQVTCDDVFDNTESGRTWAIGGKRATFDDVNSRHIFDDAPRDSIIKTETDQTLTSTITKTSTTYYIVCGNATITASGNFSIFTESGTVVAGGRKSVEFYDLKFVGSSGNTAVGLTLNRSFFYNCQFGDPGASTNFKTGYVATYYYGYSQAVKCRFYGQGASVSGGYGIANNGWPPSGPVVDRCLFQDFDRAIIHGDGVTSVNRSIFKNCTNGIVGYRRGAQARKSIFYNITGDAIYNYKVTTSGSETTSFNTTINNDINENIFVNVGGYSFYFQAWGPSAEHVENVKTKNYRYNAGDFYGGYTDMIELTGSPFVNPDSNDFSFNNHAGAGQVLRSLETTV